MNYYAQHKAIVWSVLVAVVIALLGVTVWHLSTHPGSESMPRPEGTIPLVPRPSASVNSTKQPPSLNPDQVIRALPPGLPVQAGGTAVVAAAMTTVAGRVQYHIAFNSPKGITENTDIYKTYFLGNGWQIVEPSLSDGKVYERFAASKTRVSSTFTIQIIAASILSMNSGSYQQPESGGSSVLITFTK